MSVANRTRNCKPSLSSLREQLGRVLLGKSEQIELVIACLLSQGHLLLDDLPGTGKTTLAKAIAECLGGRLARVQCTPDLLPTDVTGFNLFNQKTREFEFHAGPVFADVLLADELNRTTPRTQSALLEAMAERQVTIDAVPHPLSETFFVIATQNPIDSHGAYPLPEAQLDRFTIKLQIGYPDREAQLGILENASRVRTATTMRRTVSFAGRITQDPAGRANDHGASAGARVLGGFGGGDTKRCVDPVGRQSARHVALATDRSSLGGVARPRFRHAQRCRKVAQPVLSVRLLTTTDDVDSVIDRIMNKFLHRSTSDVSFVTHSRTSATGVLPHAISLASPTHATYDRSCCLSIGCGPHDARQKHRTSSTTTMSHRTGQAIWRTPQPRSASVLFGSRSRRCLSTIARDMITHR